MCLSGTCEIKVDDLKQNTVVAGEYELIISDKKKKKAGEAEEPSGKAEIRVYYSLLMVRCEDTYSRMNVMSGNSSIVGYSFQNVKETRPPGPGPHTYNYSEYIQQIKTGDLIVYSATGTAFDVDEEKGSRLR